MQLHDSSLPASRLISYLPKKLLPFAQLARWERPIGWELLFYPCLWSLFLGGGNFLFLLSASITFLFGAIAMRGAGCTYNDIIDKDIDAKVARTAARPLASKKITLYAAIVFLLIQLFFGLLSLLFLTYLSTNPLFTFCLATSSLVIVLIYPFMKRYTHLAQLFLGLCFSWGIFLGWIILQAHLPYFIFLFYLGCVFWVIGYDTIYALQDVDDDSLLGLHSTALLFGRYCKYAILVFYSLACLLFFFTFYFADVAIITYASLFFGFCCLLWQTFVLDVNDGYSCLRAFRSNRYFALILCLGLMANLL